MFGVKDKVGCLIGTNRRKSLTRGDVIPKRPPVALWPSLRSSSRGALLIIMACFIPVVLLMVKYSEMLFKKHEYIITKVKFFKVCAQEAALEVARNWNPGLTLSQQQEAVYKVADAVYNAHPCHYYESTLGRAVPGVTAYDINGNQISSDPSQKQVLYKTETKHMWIYHINKWTPDKWNGAYAMWLSADKMTAPQKRISSFDEVQQDGGNFSLKHQEIFVEPHLLSVSDTAAEEDRNTIVCNTPYSPASGQGDYAPSRALIGGGYTTKIDTVGAQSASTHSAEGASNLPDEPHTVRVEPMDGNSSVKVEVADDKIKVTTDEDVGYAVPAQCNVNIVLAVPTNGAACNVNNRDMASDTPENCYDSTSTVDSGRIWVLPTSVGNGKQSPKDTPIYQMGQALKNFVKVHFYHTRGVNMTLLPYSGKVSISPDRAVAWTRAFPAFVDSSNELRYLAGAGLYGTSGVAGAPLKQSAKTQSRMSGDMLRTTDTPYYWGDMISACPIIYRAGELMLDSRYKGNGYFTGLFAFGQSPASGDAYKYLRMNLNPCYVGYANMLSMKCERDCTYFLPNPYYMIEPTADLVKIYETCNALYPIYDTHNVSNFIFIPLEWAYNMFQNWTSDTASLSKDGFGRFSSGSDDGATLSRPSKTAMTSKNAIILLVNKPDWFEPGEMTYLGFNNDASEVPMIESDCIRGDINYSDTNLKFADGSAYDGTVAGPKKILKLTCKSGAFGRNAAAGWYENAVADENATIQLNFPKKSLVKVVVEPVALSPDVTWETLPCNLDQILGGKEFNGGLSGAGKGNQLLLSGFQSALALPENDDLTTWRYAGSSGLWQHQSAPAYGNGRYACVGMYDRGVKVSEDGYTYSSTKYAENEIKAGNIIFGNGIFMCFSNGKIWKSEDAMNWTEINSNLIPSSGVLAYGNGKWIAGDGTIYESYDDGVTWNLCDSSLNSLKFYYDWWRGSCYFAGHFWAVGGSPWYGNPVAYSADGRNWKLSAKWECGKDHWYIAHYKGKLFAVPTSGDHIHIAVFSGEIQFPNIINDPNGVTTSDTYSINQKREFFIEPSQINVGTDGNYYVDVNLKNLRLISAEITNRPYEKVVKGQKTCSISGTTEGTGSASITISSLEPIQFEVSPSYQLVENKEILGQSSIFTASGTTSGTGSGTLNFPSKSNLKLKVTRCHKLSSTPCWTWNGSISYIDGTFRTMHDNSGKLYYSSDGVSWTEVQTDMSWGRGVSVVSAPAWVPSLGYVILGRNDDVGDNDAYSYEATKNQVFEIHSENGIDWTTKQTIAQLSSSSLGMFCSFGEKIIFVTEHPSSALVVYDGNKWHTYYDSQLGSLYGYREGICSGNGKVLVVDRWGSIAISEDGVKWQYFSDVLSRGKGGSDVCSVTFGDGKFFVGYTDGSVVSSEDGLNWSEPNKLVYQTSGGFGLVYADGKMYSLGAHDSDGGGLCDLSATEPGKIEFTNLVSGEVTEYSIPDEREITFLPSQLAESSLSYNLTDAAIDYAEYVNSENIPQSSIDVGGGSIHAEITQNQIIVIDPDNCKYEALSDGTWRTVLSIQACSVSNLSFVDNSANDIHVEIQYQPIEPLSPLQQRVVPVNFSMNVEKGPGYTNALIYGNGDFHENSIKWDDSLNSWTTHTNLGQSPTLHGVSEGHNHYWRLVRGDFFFLTEDIGTGVPKFLMWNKDNVAGNISDEYKYNNLSFNIPGLTRHFLDVPNQEQDKARFDIYNINDGAKCRFIYSGITMPINVMLLLAYYNNSPHMGELYRDQEGNVSYDSTEAVKNVTKLMYSNLRQFVDRQILRIYLIKFRKQTKYKHPVTGAATDFDYSYLDAIASGTSAPYIYDISSEDELKSALSAVAADIKSWAGYTEARNVPAPEQGGNETEGQ